VIYVEKKEVELKILSILRQSLKRGFRREKPNWMWNFKKIYRL